MSRVIRFITAHIIILATIIQNLMASEPALRLTDESAPLNGRIYPVYDYPYSRTRSMPYCDKLRAECFYSAKRPIVSHGYELLGSPVLGYVAAFFLDPVNEVTGYFRKEQYNIHQRCKRLQRAGEPKLSSGFWVNPGGLNPGAGVRLTYTF